MYFELNLEKENPITSVINYCY